MAESVPRRARFYIESDDDEDYDVFLFYPSRNRVLQVSKRGCSVLLATILTPCRQQRENPSWEWDDNDDWSGVLEVRSRSLSQRDALPTRAPALPFPDVLRQLKLRLPGREPRRWDCRCGL